MATRGRAEAATVGGGAELEGAMEAVVYPGVDKTKLLLCMTKFAEVETPASCAVFHEEGEGRYCQDESR